MPEYDGDEQRKLKPEHEILVDAVEKVVRDVLGGEFMIPVKKHFEDHTMLDKCIEHQGEMRKNHEFVSGVRDMHSQVKKITVRVGATGVIAFVFGAVWFYIKAAVAK